MDGESSTALVAASPEATRLQLRPVAEHGLWDAAAFLQTERVATVMTDSGLMPKALTHWKEGQGNNAVEHEHPREVVFARAVLIANQAFHLEIDPVLFAQCCAIVHGRLMYEGKLVHAIIERRLGVKLRYDFGLWSTDHFEPVDDETKLWGQAERLAVRVVGQLPGEDFERTVEGSVGVWKTPQWGGQPTWRQRLRYRGAREWARAHSPGIMLGIVTPDEADELEQQIDRAALTGSASPIALSMHAGFEDKPAAEEPAAEPAQPRRRGKAAAAAAPADPNPKPEIDAALDGDDIPKDSGARPTDGAANTATDGAQTAEPEQASSGTAAPASSDTAAESSSPKASEGATSGGEAERPLEEGPAKPEGNASGQEPPEDVVSEGYPEKDEVYHLTGDAWEWDESRNDFVRDTYKNGAPFSSSKHGSGLAMYEDHRPEGAMTPAEPKAEAEARATQAEPAGEQDPVDRYIEEVEAAKSWQEIKAAMQWFLRSETFSKLAPDEQAAFRAKTWEFASALSDVEDHAASPTAFRLWIEFIEDADAIEGTLRILEKAPAFDGMQPSQKDGIRKAATVRMEALRAS